MRTDYKTVDYSVATRKVACFSGVQLKIVDNKPSLLTRHMATNVTWCWLKDKFVHMHQIREVKKYEVNRENSKHA
jgi:hypothetical protein